MKTPKPSAVGISDIHFTTATLDLAARSLDMAVDKAYELDVPLLLGGDTLDGKAIMRAECANALISCLSRAKSLGVAVYVLVGNHDRINEKSEAHSLEFLKPYCTVVSKPTDLPGVGSLLPYYSDADEMRGILAGIPAGSTIIMHQGLTGGNMGHYIQDKSALNPEDVANFRVISGHYHTRQDIKTGRPRKGAVGLFSYWGNPYTLTFGEAQDPPKGFQVLRDDGTLEFVPTNLRKHVVLTTPYDDYDGLKGIAGPDDLLWLKVSGPRSELAKLRKKEIGDYLLGHSNFKLDLIPTDSAELEPTEKPLQDTEILDNLIEALPDSADQKKYLKGLWRELLK